MKKLTLFVLATTLAATLAGVASACPCSPRVHRRVALQEMRMRSGIGRSQLARREALRLWARERHIRRMELRARRDHALTLRERARLHRALDRQSLRIHRLRQDGRWI